MTPLPPRLSRRSRRRALAALAALGAAASLPWSAHGQAPAERPLARPIPSSGEPMPIVGLGTWITFNVGNDRVLREQSTAVMGAFFESGGRLIDSSPMYGSAQDVVGDGLARLGHPRTLFAADKVWIGAGTRGPEQIDASRQRWRVPRFDLLQVHNLLAWQEHLPTLMAMKAEGRLRYIGITTSEGRRHREFEQIMREHPLDFVQFSYNVLDREAEARQRLPGWAAEIGCSTWAQVLLKFILAHPAVTCAIPATSSVEHVRENLAAARDPLPDAAMLRRIVAQVEKFA
jgi:diketogulonate reductase-like aldo/keto reductase